MLRFTILIVWDQSQLYLRLRLKLSSFLSVLQSQLRSATWRWRAAVPRSCR